jgi:hypothetical protein
MNEPGFIHTMFQVESSRTMELECVFVSPLVLRCGDSVWDFVPCQVSYLLTTIFSIYIPRVTKVKLVLCANLDNLSSHFDSWLYGVLKCHNEEMNWCSLFAAPYLFTNFCVPYESLIDMMVYLQISCYSELLFNLAGWCISMKSAGFWYWQLGGLFFFHPTFQCIFCWKGTTNWEKK